MSPARWASLEGWVPDRDRPGYLREPSRPGYLRDIEGHWYSQRDVDRARVEVDQAALAVETELESIQRVRRAAMEVLGR